MELNYYKWFSGSATLQLSRDNNCMHCDLNFSKNVGENHYQIEQYCFVDNNTTLQSARILIGDLILDETSEKNILREIQSWGYTIQDDIPNRPFSKYEQVNSTEFLKQFLTAEQASDDSVDLTPYVRALIFWVHREDVLPLRTVIIEVKLNEKRLQNMSGKKEEVEKILRGICYRIAIYFSEKTSLLKFSRQALPNFRVRNVVVELTYSVNETLIKEVYKRIENEKQQDAIQGGQRLILKDILALEPVNFYESGYLQNPQIRNPGSAGDQSIILGWGSTIFVVGKLDGVMQSSFNISPPLYLLTLASGFSTPALMQPESKPVLEFPGAGLALFDFSHGAGQIMALHLLSSWNRYVDMSVRDAITNLGNTTTDKANGLDKTLEELRKLIQSQNITEKILINYTERLMALSSPVPQNNPLHEEYTVLVGDPSIAFRNNFGQLQTKSKSIAKSAGIVSVFATFVLSELQLKSNQLSRAVKLVRTKTDVLKIREDMKVSRLMIILTFIVAIATVINVLFYIIEHA